MDTQLFIINQATNIPLGLIFNELNSDALDLSIKIDTLELWEYWYIDLICLGQP